MQIELWGFNEQMTEINLYSESISDDFRRVLIESTLGKHGKITSHMSGMCGDIFVFDQGDNVYPRWVVAKLPKAGRDLCESAKRFLREMRIQHNMYSHSFVHTAFDFDQVMGVPVGLYRMWEGNLTSLMQDKSFSIEARLAFIAYLCAGLDHCIHQGMVAHQDLKPQNILVRDLRKGFTRLPEEDVFTIPKLADFGLANIANDFGIFDGARPYKAPEQWLAEPVSNATDIFALGVIIFELMTYGYHPIGEKTQDWWPNPIVGNSKKWTRDNIWMSWVKKGVPVSNNDFMCEGMKNIANACLNEAPENRPSCSDVKSAAINALGEISINCRTQAEFRIQDVAREANDSAIEGWPYLDERLTILEASLGLR